VHAAAIVVDDDGGPLGRRGPEMRVRAGSADVEALRDAPHPGRERGEVGHGR